MVFQHLFMVLKFVKTIQIPFFIKNLKIKKISIQQSCNKLSIFLFYSFHLHLCRPSGNEPIYRNGELCGRTNTTSFGFTLKKQVCLGYVRNIDCSGNLEHVTNEYVMNGEFEVEICGIRYPAKVNLHSPNLPSMVPDKDIDEKDRYQATRL